MDSRWWDLCAARVKLMAGSVRVMVARKLLRAEKAGGGAARRKVMATTTSMDDLAAIS